MRDVRSAPEGGWQLASEALDRAHAAGRIVRVWLRDDDCVAVTPALQRLDDLCSGAGLPVLLAVVPESAKTDLASFIASHPSVTPCQHGYAHRNHAAPGERARELGGARPVDDISADLARGRVKLQRLFGARLSDILVPPWNRIDPELVRTLPRLGFIALSTFGPTPEPAGDIRRLDSDLDIIDWRNGRVGRAPEDLSRKLGSLVARQDRVGILTHHLAHDEAAWSGLAGLLELLGAHPAVRFSDAATLLAEQASSAALRSSSL